MKASDDTPTTDGGSTNTENLFTRTGEIGPVSKEERLRRKIDSVLLAPLKIAWEDIRTRVGSIILLIFVLIGTIGVRIVPTASALEGPILLPPFQRMAFPLGTDVNGRSLLKTLVHATPAMLEMIIAGALLSVCIGTLIGVTAGYKGGRLDTVLMGFTDVVLTIPGLALILVIAAIYRPESPFIVGLVLGIDNWPGLSRSLRSQVLSIREQSVLEASRIMGLSTTTIYRRDIISNLMPYISINLANSARKIIFESVGLYFIGVLPYSTNNWGVMLNDAYKSGDMTDPSQIHWIALPMLAIIVVSLGFILFAQGLDRVFNVRLRARHEKRTADAEPANEEPTRLG